MEGFMKKVLIGLLVLISTSSVFAGILRYDCRATPGLSAGTLEAGESFQLSINDMTVTYKNADIGTCSVAGTGDRNYLSILYANSLLKGCGYDGVDFLVPATMQEGNESSSLVVWADGGFDIYSCKLKK